MIICTLFLFYQDKHRPYLDCQFTYPIGEFVEYSEDRLYPDRRIGYGQPWNRPWSIVYAPTIYLT